MPFATTTEAGVPIQGPTATLIYDDWYPALRTGDASPRQAGQRPCSSTFRWCWAAAPMAASLPCATVVRIAAFPLSYGWFDGNRVTCRYHGWEFEPCGGRCELIPSLTSHDHLDATRIFATAFPCEERDGHAWVFIPGPGSGRKSGKCGAPTRAGVGQVRPSLSNRAFLTADLPCNVDHGIIGLMDPPTAPLYTRPGGGAAAPASARRPSASSPSRKAFA
jgi:hypothetical protein